MPLKFWHSCWIQWLGNQLFLRNDALFVCSQWAKRKHFNACFGPLQKHRSRQFTSGASQVYPSCWNCSCLLRISCRIFCSFFMRSNMKHTNHICKCATCGYVSFPPPLNNTSQNARLHALKSLENMTQRRHRVLGKKSGERRLLCHYTRDSSTETSLSHFSPLIAAKFWRTHKKFPKSRREINWVF